MHFNHKYILLFAFWGLWAGDGLAQTPKLDFTLTSSESGTIRDYRALNFVNMANGFTYKAESGKSFNAKIDKTINISVVSVPNPQPGNTAGAATDPPYTPGGSFNNDPVQGASGVASPAPQNITGGNGGSSSPSPLALNAYTFPILWFKTVPVTNNLNGAYKWQDITGNNTKLYKYSTSGAGSGTEFQTTRVYMRNFNFNPALQLSTDDISKEILLNKTNLTQATIMGVWGASADFDKDKFVFAVNGRRNDGVLFSKQYVEEGDTSKIKLIYGTSSASKMMSTSSNADSISKFREKALRIATYYRSNKPNTSLWGEPQKAVISLGGKFDSTNVNNTSHFKVTADETNTFKGFTPELLVFDRQLSPLDCQKFETYLAIKYGLSLDKSYMAADGSIVWNYDADTTYNHRITGYGREDGLGLFQKMSTTSYDEKPWYTDLLTYDSNESYDSYKLSSHYKLLVMGYQPGNTPSNGSYVMFGDNNKSLTFASSTITGVTKKLSREWIVNTNQHPATPSIKTLNWIDPDHLITSSEINYKRTLIKSGSQAEKSIVTQDALKGSDGYFSWTVEQEYGPITVKFGTDTAALTRNSWDYGYQIDSVGHVFAIQKGIISSYALFNVEKGQRLEVEKNGRVMSLRVNGIRYKYTEFAIDTAHLKKQYYGAVSIGRNPYDIKLTDFRHGGFVDTGNKLEFSYSRLAELATIAKENIFLLVNRNGNTVGNEPEKIACDEIDLTRSKIIFNNVFWEVNSSGKYCFGIGYYKSTQMSAKKQPEPEKEQEPEVQGDLRIYYPDVNDMSNIVVKLQTAKPTRTLIMVFDMAGRSVFRKDLPESRDIQYTEIKLPTSGIFVVKVMNNETRHTQKVISKE